MFVGLMTGFPFCKLTIKFCGPFCSVIKVIKHGRFSLYDDRLMSQIVNDSPIENNYFKKTSASMNQIKKCCDDNANSINVAMVTDHIC
jgi:hypothetical protein